MPAEVSQHNGGSRTLKSGSPRSDDVSTEMVSTTYTEGPQERNRRSLHEVTDWCRENGEWKSVPEDASDPSTLAAILSAAGRSSETDGILEASRAAAESSTAQGIRSLSEAASALMQSTPGAFSTPVHSSTLSGGFARSNDPGLQDVASRCSNLEQQMARLGMSRVTEAGPEQRTSSRERARTFASSSEPARANSRGRSKSWAQGLPRDEVGEIEHHFEDVSLPGLPAEGTPVIGDALLEDQPHHRSARRHRTMPAAASASPADPASPYSDGGSLSPGLERTARSRHRNSVHF